MTDQTASGSGGCLCGAVRYEYRGEPTSVGLCQCDRCQRQSGSAFLIGVVFPKDAVTIEGELRTYEATIDGLRLWRHFCPTCGSAVSITLERYPEIRSMDSRGSCFPPASRSSRITRRERSVGRNDDSRRRDSSPLRRALTRERRSTRVERGGTPK
jgi:hypothetical protein